MPLPHEVSDWIARSELDYIGPFVSAWAAFNAWFRHVSGSTKDREGLDHICTRPNSVRGAVLPWLNPENEDTADAGDFKQMVAALHRALEAYQLESMHKGVVERVSFRTVPGRTTQRLPHSWRHQGWNFQVDKLQTQWISRAINRAGVEQARIEQAAYSLADFIRHPEFLVLSAGQQGQLRAVYVECNPRPLIDLLNSGERVIRSGTIEFTCTPESLFSGIVETIYRMRNMLLHGELSPHASALACYQPAYHLLRRMLRECR
jgi:hypothetical protein